MDILWGNSRAELNPTLKKIGDAAFRGEVFPFDDVNIMRKKVSERQIMMFREEMKRLLNQKPEIVRIMFVFFLAYAYELLEDQHYLQIVNYGYKPEEEQAVIENAKKIVEFMKESGLSRLILNSLDYSGWFKYTPENFGFYIASPDSFVVYASTTGFPSFFAQNQYEFTNIFGSLFGGRSNIKMELGSVAIHKTSAPEDPRYKWFSRRVTEFYGKEDISNILEQFANGRTFTYEDVSDFLSNTFKKY